MSAGWVKHSFITSRQCSMSQACKSHLHVAGAPATKFYQHSTTSGYWNHQKVSRHSTKTIKLGRVCNMLPTTNQLPVLKGFPTFNKTCLAWSFARNYQPLQATYWASGKCVLGPRHRWLAQITAKCNVWLSTNCNLSKLIHRNQFLQQWM
jgi:hypothetical protein